MSFAEELKSKLNIVNVIGEYVRLKKSGSANRYVGLCPFHSERTPSFSVHSGNQFYFCFSCNATGDVFKFVQEMESLTFPEVLKTLAERNGIAVPERQRPDDPESQFGAALFEMQEIAAQVFQNNLRSQAGAAARAYLESRSVNLSTADEFRLGLSDSSGQQLVTRLKKFGPDLMEKSGLISKRDDGSGLFDRFRGRLMFPIHNEQGQVIAFGGRALRDENPKYLNSAESKIYKKSTVLYNFHRAKIDARKHDRMILVEGYMDAIGVYSAGVHEVVAVCGTSLSTDQVRSIKRQAAQTRAGNAHVILNFDPDAAGARSTEKYIGTFLAEGLRLRVLELPDGLDPDEYIQKNGADAYSQKLTTAGTYFHWLAGRARQKFDVRTAEGRVDAFKSILPAIQLVSDKVERSAITAELSEYLKLDRGLIAEQLKQAPRKSEDSRSAGKLTSGLPPNERLLVECLLSNAEARGVIKHYLAKSSVLHLLELRPIFEAFLALDQPDESFSLSLLSNGLEPRMQRILTELSFSEEAMGEDDAAQQALHCLREFEEKATAAKSSDLKRRIRELENAGNFPEAMRLMEELDSAKSAASKS